MTRVALGLTALALLVAPLLANSARNAPPQLAGLKSIWVLVTSENISGLDDAQLKRDVEAHLRKAGLQPQQEGGSPTLFLGITYSKSAECPGAVFLKVSLSLSERVRLARNRKLTDFRAATWEQTEVTIVGEADAAAEAQNRALQLVDYFADSVVYTTSVYAKRATGKP